MFTGSVRLQCPNNDNNRKDYVSSFLNRKIGFWFLAVCLFVCLSACVRVNVCLPVYLGRGPGAVAKAACLESRGSRVRALLLHSSFKETKCFFLAHS